MYTLRTWTVVCDDDSDYGQLEDLFLNQRQGHNFDNFIPVNRVITRPRVTMTIRLIKFNVSIRNCPYHQS